MSEANQIGISEGPRAQPVRRSWLPVLIILTAALVVRLIHLVIMRDSIYFRFPIMDSAIHDEWAWALASGEDTPWPAPFFRAPLYPYFLALIYKVFGHSHTWARVVQMVLGSGSVALVFVIGRRVFGSREAWIAGLVCVFYWMFLYFESELLIVPLIVFLDLVGILFLLKAIEKPTARIHFLAGLFFGLSAIARPNILLFAAAAALWLLLDRGKASMRRIAPRVVCFAAGVILPIVPVTTANLLSGDAVLIASQGGVNFYIGNNPETDATRAVVPGTRTDWWGGYHDTIVIAEQALGKSLKPSEVSRYWYRLGRDFILSYPEDAARLFARKIYLFWNHIEFGNNRDIYFVQARSPVLRVLWPVGFGIIASLGLLGMGLAWRRAPRTRILTLFVLVYMVSVVLFFVNARFRMPVVPLLILFTAYAVGVFADLVATRRTMHAVILAIPLALITLAVHSNFHGLRKTNPAFGHYNLGLTHMGAGDLESAASEFREAIRNDPDYRDARYNLGITLIEAGRAQEAEDVLFELSEQRPDDAEALYALGNIRAELGKLEDAARNLIQATTLRPYDYEAHHSLGAVRYRQGRLKEAEQSFRQALALHPRFAGAYNNLGIVAARRGDLDAAREMFEKALKMDPDHMGARENLSRLLATQREGSR